MQQPDLRRLVKPSETPGNGNPFISFADELAALAQDLRTEFAEDIDTMAEDLRTEISEATTATTSTLPATTATSSVQSTVTTLDECLCRPGGDEGLVKIGGDAINEEVDWGRSYLQVIYSTGSSKIYFSEVHLLPSDGSNNVRVIRFNSKECLVQGAPDSQMSVLGEANSQVQTPFCDNQVLYTTLAPYFIANGGYIFCRIDNGDYSTDCSSTVFDV